jgi:hypothetical protein
MLKRDNKFVELTLPEKNVSNSKLIKVHYSKYGERSYMSVHQVSLQNISNELFGRHIHNLHRVHKWQSLHKPQHCQNFSTTNPHPSQPPNQQ